MLRRSFIYWWPECFTGDGVHTSDEKEEEKKKHLSTQLKFYQVVDGKKKKGQRSRNSLRGFRPVIHLHHLISEHGLLFNFIVLIPLLFMPMFTPVLCLHVQSVCYRTAASLISFKSSAIQSPGYFSYFPSKREILPLLIGFRLSEGLAFQVRPSGKVVGVTGKAAVRSDAKCKWSPCSSCRPDCPTTGCWRVNTTVLILEGRQWIFGTGTKRDHRLCGW